MAGAGYSERKMLLAGCWWLVCSERKVLLVGGLWSKERLHMDSQLLQLHACRLQWL
jgi:hypothetical protein